MTIEVRHHLELVEVPRMARREATCEKVLTDSVAPCPITLTHQWNTFPTNPHLLSFSECFLSSAATPEYMPASDILSELSGRMHVLRNLKATMLCQQWRKLPTAE